MLDLVIVMLWLPQVLVGPIPIVIAPLAELKDLYDIYLHRLHRCYIVLNVNLLYYI